MVLSMYILDTLCYVNNFQSYVDAVNDTNTEVFSLSAASHFLAAVSASNIQFLDFEKSNQHFHNMKAEHKKLFIKVIHSTLSKNPRLFPNLLGLKIRLDHGDWWTEEANIWNTFPKSLTVLNLEIVQWPPSNRFCTLNTLVSILKRHSSTLRTLTLSWCEVASPYLRPELPPLPQLVTLEFSSGAKISKEGWSMEMLDFLKLREIFGVSRLQDWQAKNKVPCQIS